MNIYHVKSGPYVPPWADEISFSPQEKILGGASGYTEVIVDWDEYLTGSP